jgi:hypothetical protein
MGALVVGLVLGAAQLGLLWLAGDQRFFAALGRVPASRWWFALAEIVFFLFCMAAYLEVRRWQRRVPLLAGGLAVLAATDLMYHFPPLFAMLNLLSARSADGDALLTSALYRRLLFEPEVVAMVLHVWLAAIALAAVAVMRLAIRATSAPGSPPAIVPLAARAALGVSLLQLPVGLWVMFTLAPRSQAALMGSDLPGTLLFVAAIVAVFGLLHHLAAAAYGDADPATMGAQVKRSTLLVLLVVLLMTAALDRSRGRTGPAEAAPLATATPLHGSVPQ